MTSAECDMRCCSLVLRGQDLAVIVSTLCRGSSARCFGVSCEVEQTQNTCVPNSSENRSRCQFQSDMVCVCVHILQRSRRKQTCLRRDVTEFRKHQTLGERTLRWLREHYPQGLEPFLPRIGCCSPRRCAHEQGQRGDTVAITNPVLCSRGSSVKQSSCQSAPTRSFRP